MNVNTYNVTELDPRVIVKSFNPRGELDYAHIEGLKMSISKNGVKDPITVNLTSDGCYELISGYHRLTSVLQLLDEGWNPDYKIPTFVKTLTDVEAAIEGYLSNEAKSNTLIALGNTILRLKKYNLTDHEIADKIGVQLNKVRRAMVVIEAPENLLSMVKDNILSETQLYELILKHEYDYDVVEKLLKEAIPHATKKGKVTKSSLEKAKGNTKVNPMVLIENYIRLGESDQFDQSAKNISDALSFLVVLQEALEKSISPEQYWYDLTGIRYIKPVKQEKVENTTPKKRGRPRKVAQ